MTRIWPLREILVNFLDILFLLVIGPNYPKNVFVICGNNFY